MCRPAMNVVLFGPKAAQVAASPEVQAELAFGAAKDGTGSCCRWRAIRIGSCVHCTGAALMDDHALAIVALDRNASHLAEQLALKSFVPVLALSSDKSLTSNNIPWIFRLQPDTTRHGVTDADSCRLSQWCQSES